VPHGVRPCAALARPETTTASIRGATLLQDFGNNYAGDTKVKIPWVRRDLSGGRVLVMEWIDGMRCTNIRGIQTSGIDVNEFIRCGVVSGLRQLLEVGKLEATFRLWLQSCIAGDAFDCACFIHWDVRWYESVGR
jgi:hypothetical protein